MNKGFWQSICWIIPSLFFFIRCHDTEKKVDENSAIMGSPAFATLTDSIKRFPSDATLYFRRAEKLSTNNLSDLANLDYQKSWQLKPDALTGMHYATNLGIVGQSEEELQLLQDCIKKFPEEAGFKRLLGEAYIQLGKTSQAIGIYDDILKKDSSNFEAWYDKGQLLAQAKDTTAAIAALKTAYYLQPIATYALELAHIYAESNNAVALQICDNVLKSDSAHELTDPFFIKGIYYSNTKQYELANIQFDSCVRRDWKFTQAYIEKGIALFKMKNYDRALNTFRMAATVSNTNPDAYFWIGRCYEAVDKKQEAGDYYIKAIALDKNFPEAKEALKRVGG